MNVKEFFTAVGGNYENAVVRLQSEKTLTKFILKFKTEPSYAQLNEAIELGDVKNAFLAAHTLKGIAATLGFEKLAKASSNLTEELRNATVLPSEDLINAVNNAYNEVIFNTNLLDSDVE